MLNSLGDVEIIGETGDGREALELIQKHRPDVALLDITMPSLTGLTGKGIDPESLPHLFEPLWQAEGSASDGGLGLGLAIVRNLVELHGRSIHAESSGTGQGATFILKMPWSGARKQASLA